MYNKPLILTNDDMAEGVYAASGDPASSGFSYTLRVVSTWDGHINYGISFTNNTSAKVDSITVTLKVHGNVTEIGGNVTGEVRGNIALVTFNNYNNGIEANTTLNDIYMLVVGTGEFSLE